MTHPGMKSGHLATGVASAFAVMYPIQDFGTVGGDPLRSPNRFVRVEAWSGP